MQDVGTYVRLVDKFLVDAGRSRLENLAGSKFFA